MALATEISNAELIILKALWQRAPMYSADIVTAVQQHEKWHEKTIKTLLNRLVKKGAVIFEQEGRAYRYQPALSQAEYQAQASKSFVQQVFSGQISAVVAGFANQQALSQSDVDSLKAIINEWEQRQGGEHE